MIIKGPFFKVYTFFIIVYSLLVVYHYKLYICGMEKFRILEGRDSCLISEFDYLYVWSDGYECVDARYVNITSSRDVSLYNYKSYVYKLWYLNNDITEDELVEDGLKVIKNRMNTKGVYLLDSDVYRIVSEVYNGEFDSESFNRVKTRRMIEWKSDLSGLLKLDNEEVELLKGLSDAKFKDALDKITSNKKKRESLKCLNKVKMDKTMKIILNAILSVKDSRYENRCSLSDLSLSTGISYPTVKKYYERVMDDLSLDEYVLVVNKNKVMKDEKLDLMNKAVLEIKKREGMKVNKLNVSQVSGVSRRTVDKRWVDLTL